MSSSLGICLWALLGVLVSADIQGCRGHRSSLGADPPSGLETDWIRMTAIIKDQIDKQCRFIFTAFFDHIY